MTPERKLAPHVARAIGAAQAKPAPAAARPPAHLPAHPRQLPPRAAAPPPPPAPRPMAPHLQAAQAKRAPAREPAPHLKSALATSRPPAAPVRAATPPAPAVQPYIVLGSDKIWTKIPTDGKPWSGYPYVLIGKTTFKAQQRRSDQVDDEGAFLTRRGIPNVIELKHSASVRVSDDYQMAIEHSNLTTRQPKSFFLSETALQSSNTKLKAIKSPIRLVPTKRIITVVGWWSEVELKEVIPQFNAGSPDLLPQNCNAVARTVVGKNLPLGGPELQNTLLALAGKKKSDAITEKDLRAYGRGDYAAAIRRGQLNEHAAPGIGEAYMIGTNNNGSELTDLMKIAFQDDNQVEYNRLLALTQKSTVTDFSNDQEKTIPWPYHYGAVIAVSGTDRVTLENYARGDDRQENADPRWFFQMYGAARGQSFHEANVGDSYANALTLVAKPAK